MWQPPWMCAEPVLLKYGILRPPCMGYGGLHSSESLLWWLKSSGHKMDVRVSMTKRKLPTSMTHQNWRDIMLKETYFSFWIQSWWNSSGFLFSWISALGNIVPCENMFEFHLSPGTSSVYFFPNLYREKRSCRIKFKCISFHHTSLRFPWSCPKILATPFPYNTYSLFLHQGVYSGYISFWNHSFVSWHVTSFSIMNGFGLVSIYLLSIY